MKKIISVALILLLMLSLAACGSKTDPSQHVDPGEAVAKLPMNQEKTDTPTTVTTPPPVNIEVDKPTEDKQITVRVGIAGTTIGDLTMSGHPQECFPAVDAVYDVVFFADLATKSWASNVLEEWHYEDDNTFVMKLKDGIIFSNGEKATSEDLLYSYTCLNDMGNEHWTRDMGIIPEECKTRDDFTVELKLTGKTEQLFNRNIPLINAKWAKDTKWEPDPWYNPVASGPYYVAEHIPDEKIVLKLKDDYWRLPASDFYVNEYIISRYGDTSTAYMALEVGDIDICAIDRSTYSTLVKDGESMGLDAAVITHGVCRTVMLPITFKPWSDENVRRAFAIGVNWKELAEMTFGDLTVMATSFMPADGPLYVNVGGFEYDPEKAIELITAAGYAPHEIKPRLVMTESEQSRMLGEGLAFYLSQIGIDLDLTLTDITTAATVNAMVDGVDIIFEWNRSGSATRNPTASIYTIEGQSTPGCYVDDARVQELFKFLKQNYDKPVEERRAAAEELQHLIHDHVFLVPFIENTEAIGFNAHIFTRDIVQNNCTGFQFLRCGSIGLRSNWD